MTNKEIVKMTAEICYKMEQLETENAQLRALLVEIKVMPKRKSVDAYGADFVEICGYNEALTQCQQIAAKAKEK